MANTDLAPSQASPSPSPCDYESQTQLVISGRCGSGSSPKPHFLTGSYAIGAGITTDTPVAVSLPAPVPVPVPVSVPVPSVVSAPRQATSAALEQYRLQLYNYALSIERLRCPQYGTMSGTASGAGSVTGSASLVMPPWLHPYGPCAGTGVGVGNRLSALSTISLFPQSQRIFQPEEPKPQHSYIGLIAMAILSSSEIKLVLSDIYQYILDNYPYFRTRGPGWRNSIRHNLSLNDCFIKSGRSANGKGHYWAIHPANMDDFRKGDFRRRKAQRKVRKHMGLSVDDASTDSPSPPPLDLTTPPPVPGPLGSAQASLQLAALNYPYQQHYIGQFFGRQPQYAATATTTAAATATALQRQQLHAEQNTLQALEPIYQHHQHHNHHHHHHQNQHHNQQQHHQQQQLHHHQHHHHHHQHIAYINSTTTTTIANLYSQTRKRQFDVASLLAPDVQIVDIVEEEDEEEVDEGPGAGLEGRTTTQTQRTVITKVQVQKQQTIHHEVLVEQPSSLIGKTMEPEAEADIDVDGDVEAEGEAEGEGEVDHHLVLSATDNNCYRSDSFDPEEQDQQNFSACASPALGGSSAASSSQHDSNSLEECPTVATPTVAAPTSPSPSPSTSTFTSPSTLPFGLPLTLPKTYDQHILSRYYGSYMAAARRATLEASRAQSKSITTPPPPPKELLPNKL